jgi:hypothetical protein
MPSSGGPDYYVVRAREARRKQILNTPLLAAGFFIFGRHFTNPTTSSKSQTWPTTHSKTWRVPE